MDLWPDPGGLRPPDPGAVHRHVRGDQDETYAALRQGIAVDRYPAGHPGLPVRAPAARGAAAQDRAVHQRPGARGHFRGRRGRYLSPADALQGAGVRPDHRRALRTQPAAGGPVGVGSRGGGEEAPGSRGDRRHGGQVRRLPRLVYIAERSPPARRHPHAAPGSTSVTSRPGRSRPTARHAWSRWMRSSCPAGSAIAASRARSRRSGMPARTRVPYLGICLGLQVAVIEYARNVAGMPTAHSTEFDPATPGSR